MLILIVGVSVVAYSFFLKPVENEVNVCLHLSDYGCSTISQLKELGVGWTRTDWIVNASGLMSDYSQRLQDNGINLLTIIDVNTFCNQNFTIEEWKGNIAEIVNSEGFNNTDAVEVWNEPNAGAYLPPDIYYEMLKSAYVIIKNCSDIHVVFAGDSPNVDGWQDYLNTVFAFGDPENYFDCMGIHFYDDMQTNFDTLRFVEDLTTKPIWLTEAGKPLMNDDEKGQAEYLSSVYSTFKTLVDKIFIYELKDNKGLSPDKENHFGLLTIDGKQKEAYQVVCDLNGK
jgi:hypothetical protein